MPRTEGISSTDILGRILRLDISKMGQLQPQIEKSDAEGVRFLNTASQMGKFLNVLSPPSKGQKIVYVDGSFDLLSTGHIDLLKKIKNEGSYIIAGVYTDNICRMKNGSGFPVNNLDERVLSLLAIKYVDDVLIGAPYKLDLILLQRLKINEVVVGNNSPESYPEGIDPYSDARKLGILRRIDIGSQMTTLDIIKRVKAQEELLLPIYEKKQERLEAYYEKIRKEALGE